MNYEKPKSRVIIDTVKLKEISYITKLARTNSLFYVLIVLFIVAMLGILLGSDEHYSWLYTLGHIAMGAFFCVMVLGIFLERINAGLLLQLKIIELLEKISNDQP